MKIIKRLLTFGLVLMVCLSAVACAADPIPSIGSNTPAVPSFPISGGTNPAETTEPKPEIHCQYLPAEVEAPDGLPVLKWVCLPYYSETIYTEEATIEINRVLAEKEMPFRLQFIIWSAASHWDLISEPEVIESLTEADLIFGDFDSALAEAYLLPITEHVRGDATPNLQNAVPHTAYWNQGLRGQDIYGIPGSVIYPMANGWWAADRVFTSWGLSEADFDQEFWEMDGLFARIYEKNDNKPFLYSNRNPGDTGIAKGNLLNDYSPSAFVFNIQNRFQLIGSCFAIDYREGTPKVVNYLETDYVRSSQAALKRYGEAGYITTDISEMLVSYNNVFCDETVYLDDDKVYHIPAEQMHFNSTGGWGNMSGISASSAHQAEALQLLALMADDEAFRELVLFGVEGQDYTSSQTGGHSTVIREDGSQYQMKFLSPFANLYSNAASLTLPTKEGSTRLETHRGILDNCLLPCPIRFDFSAVAEETAAVNAILDRIKQEEDTDPPVLFARFGNLTEAEYNQMLAEIKSAGGDKILAELQRQLDEWLKVNPEWQ